VDDIPYLVKSAWFRIDCLCPPDAPDREAIAAEVFAVLRTDAKAIAAATRQQVHDAQERARTVEDRREREGIWYEQQMRRQAEAIARDFAGMGAADLSQGIDPHGYYVYCLWGEDTEKPIYVGKSSNILARLGSHMSDPTRRYRTEKVTLVRCKTEKEMDRTEFRLIQCHQPELNTMGVIRPPGHQDPQYTGPGEARTETAGVGR